MAVKKFQENRNDFKKETFLNYIQFVFAQELFDFFFCTKFSTFGLVKMLELLYNDLELKVVRCRQETSSRERFEVEDMLKS